MEQQLVVFDLANEHYGVDIAAVDGIIEMQPITAVPRAPAFVEGVTNLRGTVLPVIDLRKRFKLAAEDATKDTRIVVVELGDATVGMVVDAVTEVLHVAEESVEPPSPLVTAGDGDGSGHNAFITGIARVDERLIILLDLGKVLAAEEHIGLQALAQDTDEVSPQQRT